MFFLLSSHNSHKSKTIIEWNQDIRGHNKLVFFVLKTLYIAVVQEDSGNKLIAVSPKLFPVELLFKMTNH